MPSASLGSQTELAALALGLAAVAVAAALLARRHAPAVSVALLSGVVTGASTGWLLAQPPGTSRGLPLAVLTAASAALVASGLLSALLLPAAGRPRDLRPAALMTFAAAPVAGLAVLVGVQHACPLYVTGGSGACFYEDDVLGGSSAAAAVLVIVDLVAIGAMLLLTELRAGRAGRPEPELVAGPR